MRTDAGLTAAQATVIAALREGALTTKQVEARLGLARGSVFMTLQSLYARRLVERDLPASRLSGTRWWLAEAQP